MCGCSPGLVALRAQFKGLEDWGIRGFEVWGSGVKAFRSLGFRGCTVGVLELRTLEVEGLLVGVLRTRLQGVRTAYICNRVLKTASPKPSTRRNLALTQNP